VAQRTPEAQGADATTWQAYWRERGQSWRTQPEIETARQVDLAARLDAHPFAQGQKTFAYAGVRLTRPDVEWLLANHEGGRGPVDWADEAQRERRGIDLRGADLHGEDLGGLPLARLLAGPERVVVSSEAEYQVGAETHLEGVSLAGAHLEGTVLNSAYLAGANLAGAHLDAALLVNAQLGAATLAGAWLEGASLAFANLRGANLEGARAAGCKLFEAVLEGAKLAGIHLDNAQIDLANLRHADLRGAVLDGADLSYSSLEDADLTDARFVGALLKGTRLAGTTRDGANFAQAKVDEIVWERSSATAALSSAALPKQAGKSPPPRPTPGASRDTWRAYWQALGQPWRTEPEIEPARQQVLAARLTIEPDIVQGVYPFKDIEPKLTRADLEWLLATHDDGHGPVEYGTDDPGIIFWGDIAKRGTRVGLDMRGADLRGLDLRALPLGALRGSLYEFELNELQVAWDQREPLERAAAVQLSGADLRGAGLDTALLRYLDLMGADLTGASLRRTTLGYTNFEDATLRDARLDGANLEHTTLARAHLEGATLDAAQAQFVVLDGAHLEGAHMVKITLCYLTLTNVTLDGADLRQADLRQLALEGGSLAGARLDGASLAGGRLNGITLEGASLVGVNLTPSTDLSPEPKPAELAGARLAGANLREAQLNDAILRGADLWRCDLSYAVLEGAHLEDARLDEVTLSGARLDGADLTRTSLARADLRRAIFGPATILEGASIGQTRQDAPLLAGVRWEGADLMGIDWASLTALGDERDARRLTAADGTPKSRTARLADLDAALRANHQLATALRDQGLNEEATAFAYRAQLLQRRLLGLRVLWRGDPRALGRYLFSLLLAALTGYGYRMGRLVIAYVLIIALGAAAYMVVTAHNGAPLAWPDALLVSVTAFHGRVFAQRFHPGDPLGWIAAVEGVVGLVIEGIFVAMLTLRFFGK
jgi:uncharacterized protein YjbI with pentapeptide repeats